MNFSFSAKALAIAALTVLLALPAQSHAQSALPDPGAIKVAVFNADKLQKNALVFKHVQVQMTAMGAKLQAEIKTEESALRTANEELVRQRTILSPDAFAAERRKFEERVADMQRRVQARLKGMEAVRIGALKKITEATNQIIVELAKAERIAMIFNHTQMVYRLPSLDITTVVTERLNAKLPKLAVETPAK